MMQLKNIRFSLSFRLIAGVLIIATVIYLITLRYISSDYQNVVVDSAKEQIYNQAKQVSTQIKNMFDADFDLIRSFACVFEDTELLDSTYTPDFLNGVLIKALKETPRYYSVGVIWELRFLDPNWTESHGRVSHVYYRNGKFVSEQIDTLNIFSDDTASIYYKFKVNQKELATEPYQFMYKGTSDSIIMSSILVPIKKDSVFAGLVLADINLDYLGVIVDSISTSVGGNVYILSRSGNIIAHTDESRIGKNIRNTDSLLNRKFKIIEGLKQEKDNSFVGYNEKDSCLLYSVVIPVAFGKSNEYWGVGVSIPISKIDNTKTHFQDAQKVGYLGLLLLIIVTLIVAFQIINPIKKIMVVLNNLSRGQVDIVGIKAINTGDEIGQISHSVNKVLSEFQDTVVFSNHIKNGNFDEEFYPSSEKDVLGNAILEMRNSLKQAKKDEEDRREEGRQSNWTSQGINLFGEILRLDNDNLDKLSVGIISTLVDYMDVHQGGLYLVNDEAQEHFLELIASIGFDGSKMKHRKILPNEGPVGRCFLEKDTIYIDDIPSNYPPILSGLGKTEPRSSLIVPMLINEEVIGIIEVGALRPLKNYEIEFVNKIAVSIASTISTAKVRVRTSVLLEKSKEQADELAQKEEQMRLNMEDLQAMQEEATKREMKILNFINAAKSSMLYVEYDLDGKIIDINDNMLSLFQLTRAQVIGKINNYSEFTEGREKNYKNLWKRLKEGQIVENEFLSKQGDIECYLKEYYAPLLNETGKVLKVINIAFDITEEKRKLLQLAKLKKEYKKVKEKKDLEKLKIKPATIKSNLPDNKQHFEHIDLSHLRKVYKDDVKKIQNILSIYIETMPMQIKELNDASKDILLLRRKINSFETKMMYLGLDKIVKKAKEIEDYCEKEVSNDNITDLLEDIDSLWSEAVLELKYVLERDVL